MEKKNQVPKYPPLRFPEFTDEWKKVKLGEVTCERNETNAPTLPLLSITADKGIIPQIDSEKKDTSNADKSKYKRICPGDIGYNTMRMWQGRSALSFVEGIVSPAYTIVTPLEGLLPLFLSYLIKRPRLIYEFWTHSQGLVEDTLNCKYKDLSPIAIALPSLAEQKKIAALLSLIDERIEVQNAIIKEREAQKAALLRCLFDRSLRFPEFTDEWKEVKLGEVAHFSGGGTPSSEYSSYWEGTIPWISSSDIQKNNVTQINVTRFITKEALQHSSTKLCKAPCVLVVSRVGVGKVAYSDIDICTSQDFCILTDIQCEYHFLSYYLLTVMEKKVREVQGTSIKGITIQEVKSFPLRLPSLAEQKKIAALLSAVDERIAVEKEYATLLQKQKAYLLRQMFV